MRFENQRIRRKKERKKKAQRFGGKFPRPKSIAFLNVWE